MTSIAEKSGSLADIVSSNTSRSSASTGASSARQQFDEVMAPNYAPMDIIPSHGEGARLWDTSGREYLDFAAGIAVSALGHAHPELVEELMGQARKFWHVSNILTNQPALDLARRLCESTFAERVFIANSGSEANEAALKLARRYAVDHGDADKYEILAFDNSFHGRTLFTVTVGGQPKYSEGFGPRPGGVSHLPFNDVTALENWFAENGKRTCAVILEPCQGEGGVTPATAQFMQTVRAFCDQYNALLILDEVQIGVGRSGTLYAYEQFGIVPDILTTAKALGCGFPISAMLTTEKIASSLVVGTHGSTFGGNPMACAVALKALELIDTAEMRSAVVQRSQQLVDGFRAIGAKYDVFSDVRGMGLLLGCELHSRFAGRARDVLARCTEMGLLMLMAGPDVLRFAPPLILTEQQARRGLEIVESALVETLELSEV